MKAKHSQHIPWERRGKGFLFLCQRRGAILPLTFACRTPQQAPTPSPMRTGGVLAVGALARACVLCMPGRCLLYLPSPPPPPNGGGGV